MSPWAWTAQPGASQTLKIQHVIALLLHIIDGLAPFIICVVPSSLHLVNLCITLPLMNNVEKDTYMVGFVQQLRPCRLPLLGLNYQITHKELKMCHPLQQ